MDQVSVNNRGSKPWQWIPVAYYQPPSMTIPESEKGAAYASAWTRYFLSRQQSEWINYYRNNYVANMEYAIDSRWGEEADVQMFLGDVASQTSRIPFKVPMMGPMLTRMVGAVDNISISAMAESATQHFSATRKEDALLRAMIMSRAAQAGPDMAAAFEGMGISPSEQKTESIFDMNYQDHFKRGINSLMSMMSLRNKLPTTKRQVAQNMALSGMAAFHNFINGANIESRLIEPREVGWDTSAMEPDMSDGQFVYTCPLMDVGEIAERWNPAKGVIEALDKWARVLPSGQNFQAGWPQSRPRVFTMYWKDFKKVERGFVMRDGELEFCTINEVNPDTGKPDFTDVDLVEPPKNIYTDAWTDTERREKKQTKTIQVARYCSIIPWEYLPGGYTKGVGYGRANRAPQPPNHSLPDVGVIGDIVLDHGIVPIQEADPDDVYSVHLPIKIATWRYMGGHVVAPLTAARDPQRWMNQITSDVAWRLRKAGGRSTIIAKEAIADSNMTEQEVDMKVKEGDTLFLSGSVLGGLPQSSGSIDNSPGPAIYNMVGLIPQAKSIMESSVGVYESNYGAPQGQDQLVGTLQLQLQQAGVMQQPFYAAIADLYRQENQLYAQGGKEFYSRHPWILRQMVGEDDMEALIASRDMQVEQFRVKIELSPDGQQLRTITDQQVIPGLMQMGMLDPVTAAQLMGRSIPEDVYSAARKFTQQAAQAAQEQAANQEQAAMQQQMAMEQAAIRDEEADIAKQETDANLKMAGLQQKLMQPEAQAAADWNKPDALTQTAMGATP